jgi:hypothetical protein
VLIGVAQGRLVVSGRDGRRFVGGLAAGTALGTRLIGVVLRGGLLTFVHGVVDARPEPAVIKGTWST